MRFIIDTKKEGRLIIEPSVDTSNRFNNYHGLWRIEKLNDKKVIFADIIILGGIYYINNVYMDYELDEEGNETSIYTLDTIILPCKGNPMQEYNDEVSIYNVDELEIE